MKRYPIYAGIVLVAVVGLLMFTLFFQGDPPPREIEVTRLVSEVVTVVATPTSEPTPTISPVRVVRGIGQDHVDAWNEPPRIAPIPLESGSTVELQETSFKLKNSWSFSVVLNAQFIGLAPRCPEFELFSPEDWNNLNSAEMNTFLVSIGNDSLAHQGEPGWSENISEPKIAIRSTNLFETNYAIIFGCLVGLEVDNWNFDEFISEREGIQAKAIVWACILTRCMYEEYVSKMGTLTPVSEDVYYMGAYVLQQNTFLFGPPIIDPSAEEYQLIQLPLVGPPTGG